MGIWVILAIQAASFIISRLTAKKPKRQREKPKGLGEFTLTTATEGRPVPVIFGRVRIDGPNVIWYGNLTWDAIGHPIKLYRYHLGIQWALCRGPVDALVNIWVGKKKLWSGPHVSGDPDIFINQMNFFDDESDGSSMRGGLYGLLGFKFGATNQTLDPYLATWQTPSTGYNGTCYAVWRDTLDGTTVYNRGGYVGNDASMEEWQWEVERYPNTLGMTSGHHRIGNGANPACVLYELLTNTEYGIGELRLSINVPSFMAAAETFYDEGNGFRYLWDSESDIESIKNEVERQTDSVLIFNHGTGLWDLVLFRLDYNPATVPVLDSSVITGIDDTADASWEETFNIVRVEYSEPTLDYESTYALAQDPANQAITGRITPTTNSYTGCKSAPLANALAWRDLRQGSLPSRKFDITANRKVYGLKFGDVRQIVYGNFNFRARVVGIDYSGIDDNNVKITVVREVYRNEPGSFADPDPTYWQDSGTELDALSALDQVVIDAPKLMIDKFGDTQAWPQLMTVARKAGTGNTLAVQYRVNARVGTTSGGETTNYTIRQLVQQGFAMIGTLTSSIGGYSSTLPDEGTQEIFFTKLADDSNYQDRDFSEEQIDNQFLGIAVISPGTASEEWILCQGVFFETVHSLTGCYRGAFDTAIKAHAAGERIWMLWRTDAVPNTPDIIDIPRAGVGLIANPSELPLVNHYYKMRFQPSSASAEVPLGDCAELSEVVAAIPPRYLRPLLPREMTINGTRYAASASHNYDTGGGVLGIKLAIRRCQWRNLKPLSQLRGFDVNGYTPFTDTALDSLVYSWTFYDLTAHPTPLPGDTFRNVLSSASSIVVTKAVLESNLPSFPRTVRVVVKAIHTPSSRPDYVDLQSRDSMTFDFTVT